jgi:hypothetical protein
LKRLLSLFLLELGACQAFTRPDIPATLRAENAGYVIEATSIYQTAQAEDTRVQITAVAAAATIASINNINQQLMATARAVIPPTAQIAGAGITESMVSNSANGGQFVEVGTASSVRDSDGCADGLQSQFSLAAGPIYVTARALNIRAGTLMGVEWRYEGAVAHQENFVVPGDDDNYCIWFNLEAFSAGNWTVRLYKNEVPIEPEVIFTVEGVAPEGG